MNKQHDLNTDHDQGSTQGGSKVPLAYDVTRLFLGPLNLSPRGIDRVELMLAEYFFHETRQDVWGLLPTPWGVRLFPASRVRRGLQYLLELWGEDTETDTALDDLITAMRNQTQPMSSARRHLTVWKKVIRIVRMIRATGFTFGRSAKSALPANAAYLNVGHLTVSLQICLRWLKKRPDVKAVFMLHDAIPIAYPQLVEPSSVGFHSAVLRNTAQFADALIVTTSAAKREIDAHIDTPNGANIEHVTIPLPISSTFERRPVARPRLGSMSFFLVCGAIETRKNLTLLLHAWEQLASEPDADIPHLVVAGSPHFGYDDIRNDFEKSVLFGRKIHFVHGLKSRSIATLMQSAEALLMPSLAEGFGLPLKEAMALGCPVIASDIAAHREVLDGHGLLLNKTDTNAWCEAIKDHTSANRKPDEPPLENGRFQEERSQFTQAFEQVLVSPKLSQQPKVNR